MASASFHGLTALVVGAGNRGKVYSSYSLVHPQDFRVVAVCEPRKVARDLLATEYKIADSLQFETWEDAVAVGRKLADIAIITTPDAMHCKPAVAFAKLGYHILLEKPMAVTEKDCEDIVKTCAEAKVTFAVCHVLRYTPCNRKIREIIQSGLIGDVVNIQHLEPVGFFHFAHSYVRGNWRNTAESTFSLMAKSCHDIDLLQYWIGSRCKSVSSFGSLKHFVKKNKPQEAGNATRCMDCPYEEKCCYSAKKIYLEPFKAMGHTGWPVSIIVDGVPDIENIGKALKTGPYGRCVYECDNDVCDNQVVNLTYENGVTASFTMVAFSEKICERQTRIFGTKGELTSDSHSIYHFDFLTQKKTEIRPEGVPIPAGSRMFGHGGADYHTMHSFITSLKLKDQSRILSGGAETLESHRIVFRAEESRLKNTVVSI